MTIFDPSSWQRSKRLGNSRAGLRTGFSCQMGDSVDGTNCKHLSKKNAIFPWSQRFAFKVPRPPHQKMGTNNSTYIFRLMWGSNELLLKIAPDMQQMLQNCGGYYDLQADICIDLMLGYFLLEYSSFTMLLVSGTQQSDSVLYFFHISFHYRLLQGSE